MLLPGIQKNSATPSESETAGMVFPSAGMFGLSELFDCITPEWRASCCDLANIQLSCDRNKLQGLFHHAAHTFHNQPSGRLGGRGAHAEVGRGRQVRNAPCLV